MGKHHYFRLFAPKTSSNFAFCPPKKLKSLLFAPKTSSNLFAIILDN
jgi:hypothetical protein